MLKGNLKIQTEAKKQEVRLTGVHVFGAINVPVTPTPSIFPKALPYKWGTYCRTNGRRTAVQMGGVLQGFPFFEA